MKFCLAALVVLTASLAGCSSTEESRTYDPYIKGRVVLKSIDGQTVASPYDSVYLVAVLGRDTITRQTNADGTFLVKTPERTFYDIYARAQGFGVSKVTSYYATTYVDTVALVLGEEPTVRPVLDSIAGSVDSGYRIYSSMPPQGHARLGLLIRKKGDPEELFEVLAYQWDEIRLDTVSGQWLARTNSHDSSWAATEIAAVAFNPSADVYSINKKKYFCSHGPISNVLAFP